MAASKLDVPPTVAAHSSTHPSERAASTPPRSAALPDSQHRRRSSGTMLPRLTPQAEPTRARSTSPKPSKIPPALFAEPLARFERVGSGSPQGRLTAATLTSTSGPEVSRALLGRFSRIASRSEYVDAVTSEMRRQIQNKQTTDHAIPTELSPAVHAPPAPLSAGEQRGLGSESSLQ